MAPKDSPGKNTNKTKPTAADAAQFIDAVDTSAVRRTDAHRLLDIMAQETGEPAVMWGPSIVGFGSYHYKYASGREGDAAAVGFSPRKAKLVIYGLTYPPRAEKLLERLGTFQRGAGCVYLNKLADVNEGVLRQLIRAAFLHLTTADVQSLQSQKGK